MLLACLPAPPSSFPPPPLRCQNVASISAGNDDAVGEMIADALDKVGSNGVLSIESSSSTETVVEVTEGMEIDRGYISPQFVTNSERLLVEYDNCKVLVTDQKIESVRDIIPILEQVGGGPLRAGGWVGGWVGGLRSPVLQLACAQRPPSPALPSVHPPPPPPRAAPAR